jgi:hypothetical protein
MPGTVREDSSREGEGRAGQDYRRPHGDGSFSGFKGRNWGSFRRPTTDEEINAIKKHGGDVKFILVFPILNPPLHLLNLPTPP